ncbi:MAG TPA: response regulator, partial [Candidatus Paceibacterota bacterium]|nr:response regulator [Candidatus Paceibacterota bacterium]
MEAGSRKSSVLIIDDDRGLLRLIERALQREGFGTATAASGKEALAWLSKNQADLLLLDLHLQDFQGRELIRRISETQPVPPFIIITGQGDERVAVEMMKSGARDYLVKDVEFLQFVPEVVRNVLEQIETERRLAAAEEQVNLIQSVVEQGFSAVLIASPDMPDPKVLYINPSFSQLTGYAPDQIVGKPLSQIVGFGVVPERMRQWVPGQGRFVEELSSYQNRGGESWAEWRIGPVNDKSGRITHWLVIMRDITDRKRLEKEILEINDRVQRRIGQDLHDGLCQQLAGIELMCQVLEQKVAVKSKGDAARIGEIAGHVRDSISQTRLMARGLSPIMLESEGLMSGLQELASNTEKIFHVPCVFKCDPPVLVDNHAAATHLFRIAQEAIFNAIRHGKATRTTITLQENSGKLVLKVTN